MSTTEAFDRSEWQTSQNERRQRLGLGMATTKKKIDSFKSLYQSKELNTKPQSLLESLNRSKEDATTTTTATTTTASKAFRAGAIVTKTINCFGKFQNKSDLFFGKGRKELLEISENEDGTYQGLKLVGDINVPRGKISWRSLNSQSITDVFGSHRQAVGSRFNVEFQVRDNVNDENDYSWISSSGEGSFVMRYMLKTDQWKLSFLRVGKEDDVKVTAEYFFVRVLEREAKEMIDARDSEDWK